MEVECVKNIKVDTTNCPTPCSGLIVTSFAKYEMDLIKAKIHEMKELEDLFPAYDDFKKITQYPSGYTGKDLNSFTTFYV